MGQVITEGILKQYQAYLREEEKSENTIQKYLADIRKLMDYADGREITKSLMLDYKDALIRQEYKVRSVNSYLVAANRFFAYMEWYGLNVKQLKLQKETFIEEERELSKAEYKQLVAAAKSKGKLRLAMIIMTICATGIRISELNYVTVESVKRGKMEVDNKGKRRQVILPKELQKALALYIARQGIERGIVFCTASGKAVSRSNVWKEMKMICKEAGVEEEKVFPHNLRHLFARIFYSLERNLAKLADILGHGSIETTRIYVRSSSREYQEQLKQMGLVLEII